VPDPVELLFRAWSGFYDLPVLQGAFYRRVHAALMRGLDRAGDPPRVVVDLGCGTAQLTVDLAAKFPRATVLGVDFSGPMLEAAHRRLGDAAPPLVRGNVYALPLADASVDLLVSTISYHWYLDSEKALAEIRRVVRPGGRFVLATLSTRWFDVVVAKQRWVSSRTHAADLAAAGFTVRDVTAVRPSVRIFDTLAA
jgi:ubiquinone/menaquinone biosynthesis C-methylase UbiE